MAADAKAAALACLPFLLLSVYCVTADASTAEACSSVCGVAACTDTEEGFVLFCCTQQVPSLFPRSLSVRQNVCGMVMCVSDSRGF